jgi:hypothetical protein
MAIKVGTMLANNLFSNNGNTVNSLFDALNKNKNTSSSVNMLQMNNVNNGAYRKALRAYYQQEKSAANSNIEDSNEKMTAVKAAATSLKESAADVSKASLYEKDENGQYNLDEIRKAVNTFVNDYNKMVDEAGKSESMEALRNGVWMVNNTKSNQNLLSKVGITVGKDNKLSFNEAKLNQTTASSFKSAFSGHSSFGGRVESKALTFENIAKRSLSNHTYNRSGRLAERATRATKLDKDV